MYVVNTTTHDYITNYQKVNKNLGSYVGWKKKIESRKMDTFLKKS